MRCKMSQLSFKTCNKQEDKVEKFNFCAQPIQPHSEDEA